MSTPMEDIVDGLEHISDALDCLPSCSTFSDELVPALDSIASELAGIRGILRELADAIIVARGGER